MKCYWKLGQENWKVKDCRNIGICLQAKIGGTVIFQVLLTFLCFTSKCTKVNFGEEEVDSSAEASKPLCLIKRLIVLAEEKWKIGENI